MAPRWLRMGRRLLTTRGPKPAWHGLGPRKAYRRLFPDTINEEPVRTLNDNVIDKITNNDQINSERASRNFLLGPDDPIEPPVHLLEGLPPLASDYPRTRREIETFPMTGWVRTGVALGWSIDINDDPVTVRRLWRGKTGTFD
ncbi:hypothetical protein BJ508DRAFT_313314 [Ascobolus immersus RN42]|uniref:Uncharacterized protein n=1 Tax=Ascobolus immersus RN42 TaxID=1160509 RepID=A0A3N4HJ59_ASCIM|nr:hypothetical protein BJ508DRAFT_313314 [Ascobolus immersus RN42]